MSGKNLTKSKKKQSKYVLIIVIILGMFLAFWRYNYFLFVPNLSNLQHIPENQLNPELKKALSIPADSVKQDSTVNNYEFLDSGIVLPEFTITAVKGNIYNESSFTITSKEHAWKSVFDDYYSGCVIVAANKSLIAIYCTKGEDWKTNSMSASTFGKGPSILLNFEVNRSKIPWDDIFILNKNTGKRLKHYRTNEGLLSAYSDYQSNNFYFRTGEFYYHLKL